MVKNIQYWCGFLLHDPNVKFAFNLLALLCVLGYLVIMYSIINFLEPSTIEKFLRYDEYGNLKEEEQELGDFKSINTEQNNGD